MKTKEEINKRIIDLKVKIFDNSVTERQALILYEQVKLLKWVLK